MTCCLNSTMPSWEARPVTPWSDARVKSPYACSKPYLRPMSKWGMHAFLIACLCQTIVEMQSGHSGDAICQLPSPGQPGCPGLGQSSQLTTGHRARGCPACCHHHARDVLHGLSLLLIEGVCCMSQPIHVAMVTMGVTAEPRHMPACACVAVHMSLLTVVHGNSTLIVSGYSAGVL